ncbi:hypothetical protein DL93DRAFT_2073808 [Clavulina sp. PMI_390]|nr:hypothetical protein DL93DRAFT_2073808 [Clavulina sp. PMI_390]
MATLQKYFDFKFGLTCGIPSVTLLGSREDWTALRAKVDKFAEFGSEPQKWVNLLQPVCDAFVGCFEERQLDQSKDFWSRVCHYDGGGSGPTYLCGWATVFTAWNQEGKWQGDGWKRAPWNVNPETETKYGRWPIIDTDKIAPGCAEVPVLVDDNGTQHHTVMLAGLPGIRVTANEQGESVVAPLSGWAMFDVPATE